MKRWNNVAIVGVGLIGGSIGLALRERKLAAKVVGVGRRLASLNTAHERGAIDAATTDLALGVKGADLVVVCTPVNEIAGHVREAAEHCAENALITDVGSTKQSIVEALDGSLNRGVDFVGSHPLAGSDKTGPAFAQADLLENRVVVVTPGRKTPAEACGRVTELWEALGARVVQMTPAAHDAAVAATSHVPHLVASALAAATPEDLLPLVAGGWLDSTRVAGGDPELWRQILLENRVAVLKSLDKFEKVLASLRGALEGGEAAAVLQLLEAGKKTRDSVGS